MRKTNLLANVILAAGLLASSVAGAADVWVTGKVKMAVNDNGDPWVWVHVDTWVPRDGCTWPHLVPVSGGTVPSRIRTQALYEGIFSTILAHNLAGKDLAVRFDTTACQVISVSHHLN